MRRAFTIVEMLGATLLAALLMAAALTVVGSLGRTQRALDRANEKADDAAEVFELLRFDLANAGQIAVDEDALIIRGTGRLTRDDARPTLLAADVRYDIEERAGRGWLVRSQQDVGTLSNQAAMRRPLREGVTRFTCELIDAEVLPEVPDDVAADVASLPRAVRVTIESSNLPIAREVIFVR